MENIDFKCKFDYTPYKENIEITGAAQHGKSEHAISLCDMLYKNGFNVVIFDLKARFTRINPRCVIHTIAEVTGKGLEIVQPYKFNSDDALKQFFSDLCWKVYSLRQIVFVMDELHSVVDARSRNPAAFDLICKTGNNDESLISYIGVLQSASDIPKVIVRNATHHFVLYIDEPNAVDYYSRFISKDVKLFSEGGIPKFTGIYKRQGQPAQRFKVVKLD